MSSDISFVRDSNSKVLLFKQPRDPRFLPLAGEFSAQKFQTQYGFLADIHSNELKTLRDSLKRARKLLASSPRDLREEREREVNRLEMAGKRTESVVNKDRRDKIEHEALSRVAKEEREKRKQGKGGWWMKNGEYWIYCTKCFNLYKYMKQRIKRSFWCTLATMLLRLLGGKVQ